MAIRKATGRVLVAMTVVICVVAFLAGCGGSESSSSASAAEARFVALANVVCSKTNPRKATSPPTTAELARLRTLERTARNAPRVATLISDLAAQRRLRASLSKLSKKGFGASHALSSLGEVYRLDVRVYADEKALGMTSASADPQGNPSKVRWARWGGMVAA